MKVIELVIAFIMWLITFIIAILIAANSTDSYSDIMSSFAVLLLYIIIFNPRRK